MNQDLSILHLVLNASLVVQLVMLLLVLISISSWAAIFRKLFSLKRVATLNDAFEREFWSGTSLNDLFAAAAKNARDAGPMERIFRDQHAAAGHINFSMDAQASAWGLAALGGPIASPTL